MKYCTLFKYSHYFIITLVVATTCYNNNNAAVNFLNLLEIQFSFFFLTWWQFTAGTCITWKTDFIWPLIRARAGSGQIISKSIGTHFLPQKTPTLFIDLTMDAEKLHPNASVTATIIRLEISEECSLFHIY